MRPRGSSPLLALVIGAIVISWSAVLVRLAQVDAVTATLLRLGYAALVLGVIVVVLGQTRALTSLTRMEAATGALFAASVLLQNLSITMLGAGLATVVDNTQVIQVPLALWLLGRGRPTRATAVAIALAASGVVTIAAATATTRSPTATAGVVVALLTANAYTAFLLVLPHARRESDPLVPSMFRIVVVATACTGAVALATGASPAVPLTSHLWLIVLAVGPQTTGWLLLTRSASQVDPTTTALTLTLQPALGLLLAAAVLHERLSAPQAIGCSLVVVALVVRAQLVRGPSRGPSRSRLRARPDATRAAR